MAESKEDIIANLRAIVISSKGGLKLSDVKVDYRETFGEDVPLKALGCGTLEEFFKNNSQDFSVIGNRVQAVTKASSVHLVSLISKQQNSKKRGRSKLTSKQAHHLRQPFQSSRDPYSGVHSKKSGHHPAPKFTRQNSNKETLSNSLKQAQMNQVAAIKKEDPSVPSAEKTKKEEKNTEIQSHMKNFAELKGITRTVKNDKLQSAKDSVSSKVTNEAKTEIVGSKDFIPFQDFEDLQITNSAQSRLLKLKSNLAKSLSNSDGFAKYASASPATRSPFQRSLANNSQREILSAKKSAQVSLLNGGGIPRSDGLSPANQTVDLEDDTKYEHSLKQFCIEKGLAMPCYSIIIREPINQPKCYGCKLTIGNNFQVSTYPVETHSEITARELASKKAFNQLNNNSGIVFFETENVVKLRDLCSQKNLPNPVFKTIECHPKNEPRYFICKVRIGEDILLSSYPMEAQDEVSAKDEAAKKALDHLSSLSKSPIRTPKDDSSTLLKIHKILESKEHGVWFNKLPILYMEEYNEELQQNWLEIVKNSPKFEVTKIENVGHIIRVRNGVLDGFEEEGEPAVLADLKLPQSNQWEVYITNVVNSTEIWCRLIGKEYSEVYDTMMTKLELQPPTMNAKRPVVGGVYLINLEESWNRVKVKELFPEKEQVSVFLVDIGIKEIVQVSQLFELQKCFFSVPPQALMLTLNELDCLSECDGLQSALFDSLLGNSFIAEVVSILNEDGNIASVNLWDTSTEDDINVNLKLLDIVIKGIKRPLLPRVGLVEEMFVSYVDDNGDVYVTSSKQNAHYVDWIVSTKMKNSGTLVPVTNKKVDPKKLYVTRCNKTGLFYRAKLSKILDPNTVVVKFVDYGYEQRTAIDDMFDLEETSLELATIPCQALRVKIANLKVMNNKTLARIREHLLEQSVLVKVIQVAAVAGGAPMVEFFKRSQSDGTLSSINNKIANDTQLQTADTPIRKKSFVVGLENTLSRNLPVPNIPPIGSYFNVFVILAAHPGLFNVQPLTTQNELMELMFRLQEKCERTFSKPLKPEDFKIGELYAVKHADEFWYRAYAHAVVSPSAYTVYLCDFGDFVIVPAEKLMPLPGEFKMFPYQAIRAYLAGIEPANKDWSVLDCVNFRELVIEKQFVSQIKEINRDANNPNYISLGLTLVDTSTEEDLFIHQLLLDRKIAVLKS